MDPRCPSCPLQGTLPLSRAYSPTFTILIPISYAFLLTFNIVCVGGGYQAAADSPLAPAPPRSYPFINLTHGCFDSERRALLQFKAALLDPHDRLSSWQGLDCCRWRGVACDDRKGAVVQLDLSNPYQSDLWNLSGRIDASLLHLKSLRHLDLGGNTFNGLTIPAFIGSFKELRYLGLSNAGFTGTIPPQLGIIKLLRHLDLSWNTFYGITIPAFIGSFKELRYLNLSNTWFMGTIPPQLGNLTRLQYLDISHSVLRADSLQWVSGLSSLRHLQMDGVNLSAVGSDWIQILNERLPFLVELHLQLCDLRSITTSLHSVNFTSLEVIDLSGNPLSSRMPSWLTNITSLVSVDMVSSSLHGPIPVEYSKLPNLHTFLISVNEKLATNVSELLGHGGWPRINTFRCSKCNLYGKIPASIENLTSLVELDLSYNNVGGGIPASIGKMCNLTFLDISSNNLTDDLPGSMELPDRCSYSGGGRPSPILPRLERLTLSDNSLTGNLPAWLNELTSLKDLDVSFNTLTGNLHVWPHEHTSLEELDVSFNRLTGIVTEAHFSKLKKLSALAVGHNSLILNISSSWIPPFQLLMLDAVSCQLGPQFPSWLKTQTKLQVLDLSNSGISDEVPAWFWDLSSNISLLLNVSFNNMSGQVPSSWTPSPQLSFLDMRSNQLHGRLPTLHIFPSSLMALDLSANLFYGPIWPNIGQMMPSLEYLSLAGNYLTGEIPAMIGELDDLQVLDLSKNNFTGDVPTTLLDCSSLVVLNLGSNSLTRAISASPGRLQNLKVLQLNDNMLSGEIPLSIHDCSALQTLDLGQNLLQGNIPTWIGNFQNLRILRLRSNRFSGEIPSQLSNMRSLQVLDIAQNNLIGAIPIKLGSLQAMVNIAKMHSSLLNTSYYYKLAVIVHAKGSNLEFVIKTDFLVTSIDLSGNKLSGEFPKGLVDLSGLVYLDLSKNYLIGTLPDGIGDMHQLESLDLSNNHFSGKIPASMALLTFLEVLNLSNNNFSGKIPTGGQLQTFSEASFLGNPYLCGSLVL